MIAALLLLGCARRGRVRAPQPDLDLDLASFTAGDPPPIPILPPIDEEAICVALGRHDFLVQSYDGCGLAPREVRAWGPAPREGPPGGVCPMRVRSLGDHVVAQPLRASDAFPALPFRECVPRTFATGSRHVVDTGDGFLVAYETPYEGLVFWTSYDGSERRPISKTRVLGFARSPSGSLLALARGKARLGQGGVLRFEAGGRGEWKPTLLVALPVEPSGATLDDHGALVGFAQGFVLRIDETGRVENVHYVSRTLGRVASIARDDAGRYYLGLECGVLRIDVANAEDHEEQWWSARDGASGRWSECGS